MIQSFHDRDTDRLFHGERVLAYHGFAERAYDKLVELNKARSLQELYIRRGNRLESLSGNREGQHSIRINRQWRVCFRWYNGDAYDVEIADYH